MASRTNILLITSDQQRGDCYGFEGRRVRTPHLDDLAREGTRFAACITPNLVCQPSRASILTGLLPLTHGVSDNGIELTPATGEAGFAGTLGRAGYDTGYIGKAHFALSEWDLRATRSGVDLELRTVRARRHKLTVDRKSGAGELYDLENDPQEMDNRFDDPGCRAVRKELEEMLASRPDDVLRPPLPQVGMA